MNLISMTLFSTQTRYWYTLLPAIIANLELYPGFRIRLHVATEALAHPISPLLALISDATGRLDVYEYSDPYTGTEPTFWRMRPLWDQNVDVFFCRDIDSVPSTEELQAVSLFMAKEQYAIHSIRSYHLHTTLLMAGLCGFRNRFFRGPFLEALPTYESYLAYYNRTAKNAPNFQWGCDQEALMCTFVGFRNLILDHPIGNCAPHHPCAGIPTDSKEVIHGTPLVDLDKDLLAICDEITALPWGEFKGFAGRPQGDFRPYLGRMLDLPLPVCQAVRKVLEANQTIQDFYKA